MSDVLIVTAADEALLRMMRLDEPLRRELDRAIVVSSEAVPEDVATMNSLLAYTDETAGLRATVALVYRRPPAGHGLVSVLEPLGSALLGLSAGRSIDWQFPDGRHRLRLDAVLFQPEQARRAGGRPSPCALTPARGTPCRAAPRAAPAARR